ncbi:hypothetical protein [Actinomadura sp. 3N508]|uniref:hypothetical protein n=1 Tax=Actinomadura sp. 3N508 TaxID=3375153 RepID=UPI00379EFAB5
MNSESDQQPGGPARTSESASGPPAPAALPSEVATPPPEVAPPRPDATAPRPAAPVTPSAVATPPPEAADDPAPAPTAETTAETGETAENGAESAVQVTDVTVEQDVPPRPGPQGDISPEEVREHLRRRAIFLRELAEARELRRRVTPHRSRRARIHAALRRRTFRIN